MNLLEEINRLTIQTKEKQEENLVRTAKKNCDVKRRYKLKRIPSLKDSRTHFQLDRDRIIYSRAFRALSGKSQVFISLEEKEAIYRTRLTHTLEVAQIARTMSRMCRLNEDLAEAIALGHDLGHPPFGHAGEAELEKIIFKIDKKFFFQHNIQSLHIVDDIEKDWEGLHLTNLVRDGIIKHTEKRKTKYSVNEYNNIDLYKPTLCLEAEIVHWADEFAQLSHDLDDALKAKCLNKRDILEKIPSDAMPLFKRLFGKKNYFHMSQLINPLKGFFIVKNRKKFNFKTRKLNNYKRILENDMKKDPNIKYVLNFDLDEYSTEIGSETEKIIEAYNNLKECSRKILDNKSVIRKDQSGRLVISALFELFYDDNSLILKSFQKKFDKNTYPLEKAIVDYISTMTERTALDIFRKFFI